jgi:hypothetical protein
MSLAPQGEHSSGNKQGQKEKPQPKGIRAGRPPRGRLIPHNQFAFRLSREMGAQPNHILGDILLRRTIGASLLALTATLT